MRLWAALTRSERHGSKVTSLGVFTPERLGADARGWELWNRRKARPGDQADVKTFACRRSLDCLAGAGTIPLPPCGGFLGRGFSLGW